ncbi:hypothetical protein PVAND_005596 [Polypedilum vanderplanki]|uniref:cysteine--tRNA ligase n=1 Tax=Polypedilum vanderplanki TaxID=319348 RepID=A0A9J6C1N0_POLVA|nr:hypothetical protein PVAND_005596 [Polypedilum vanderplanki]
MSLLRRVNFNLSRLSKRTNCHGIKTDINIYSYRDKRKVPLVLANPIYSSWYTCGPTVYDSAHIGHGSTYVRLDIIQRILRNYFNINLVTCMNITNIDDKIIKRSNELGKDWNLLAEEYEIEFWDDLNKLNIMQPDIKLRVTDKIPEIIKFIEEIEKKGYTTISTNGSVNFKTSAYSKYGKLHNVVLEDVSTAEFALWKAAKENEPWWDSKWGRGRPGWHIECSTLASLVFGSHLDFHAGGIDLKFPHHENEEAQSCVFHNCNDWVQNWIHTGHLHLKGQSEKMSKSLKNTISIRDFLKDYTAEKFRMACLLSHYRSSIEFGPELMFAADSILKRVKSFKEDVKAFISGAKIDGYVNEEELRKHFQESRNNIDEALRDDFHTAACIGQLSDLMRLISKTINNVDKKNEQRSSNGNEKALLYAVVNYIDHMLQIFGIGDEIQFSESYDEGRMENLVNSIIKVRNDIRLRAKETKSKELFQVCDEIRQSMRENLIEIKDHGNLSSWSKVK